MELLMQLSADEWNEKLVLLCYEWAAIEVTPDFLFFNYLGYYATKTYNDIPQYLVFTN
jgi:hypothetical protein